MLSNEKKLYQYKYDRDRWHHGNLLEWRLFLIFSGSEQLFWTFLLSELYKQYTYIVDKYKIYFYEL
jgi:hypothetical protein